MKRNVRQRYSSIASAIAATAPEATPLFSPHTAPPPAGIQRDDNSPIVVNGVKIPSLCGDIKRKDTLEEALEFLTRTKIEEDSTTAPPANDSLNSSPEKHRACISVLSATVSSLKQRKFFGSQKTPSKIRPAI